jgi:hypothetical protein
VALNKNNIFPQLEKPLRSPKVKPLALAFSDILRHDPLKTSEPGSFFSITLIT